MKLLRYGPVGQEKPGILDQAGKIRDLSAQIKDVNGAHIDDATLAKIAALDLNSLPLVDDNPRIGAWGGLMAQQRGSVYLRPYAICIPGPPRKAPC